MAEVELAHDRVLAATDMVLHLADEVRFLVAPVLAGAAVGGEDEPVRVRVDDFMDVVAPPVAFLLLVLFLRLVAVEGDQRHAQLILSLIHI